MSDATQRARQRRLKDAGYTALSGYLPAARAAEVQAEVDAHREEVERIKARADAFRKSPDTAA